MNYLYRTIITIILLTTTTISYARPSGLSEYEENLIREYSTPYSLEFQIRNIGNCPNTLSEEIIEITAKNEIQRNQIKAEYSSNFPLKLYILTKCLLTQDNLYLSIYSESSLKLIFKQNKYHMGIGESYYQHRLLPTSQFNPIDFIIISEKHIKNLLRTFRTTHQSK